MKNDFLDCLQHADRKHVKYIAKVKTFGGRTRYFYSQSEYDAYMKKDKKLTDEVAYSNVTEYNDDGSVKTNRRATYDMLTGMQTGAIKESFSTRDTLFGKEQHKMVTRSGPNFGDVSTTSYVYKGSNFIERLFGKTGKWVPKFTV